jgi:hypothetical protein
VREPVSAVREPVSAVRHPLLPLLLAAAAVALWLPAGFRALAVREQLVLGALSVILLTSAALLLILRLPEGEQGITRWRIGPWHLLWSGLAFGVAPLTWLQPQTGSATRIALTSVVTALLLFGVSIVPWTLGYCAGVPRGLRAAAGRGVAMLLGGTATAIRGPAMPWILYGVGSAARLVTVTATGRFGYVGEPSMLVSYAGPFDHLLKLLSTLALFAVAAAAYRAFSDTTRGSRLTLWLLVSAEAVVGALAGGKQYFILSVLAVLIPYGVLRGRLSLRILLAGLVVFLWIAVPFNTAYRQVVRSEESTLSPSAAVEAAPGILSEVVVADSFGAAVTGSSIQMLERVRMIDSVAIVTQLTPGTIPYRSPGEFAAAPVVGLVPRVLWPDKPVLATGYEFSQDYYGTSRDMYTSAGITPLGDLYRHGGPLTVLVGMLLLGMGARLFDTLFRPERDPRAICFLLAFLPMLLRVDIFGMIVGIPSALVLATLGARLIWRHGGDRRDRGPARVAPAGADAR